MVVRQFDLFHNPSVRSRSSTPYLVVLQSHFLEGMPIALVAPVRPRGVGPAYSAVSVQVVIDERACVVSLPEMAPIEVKSLDRATGTLRDFEDQLRRAIERLFTGF